METYSCAYRDLHSPLTPLTPISDITLRKTFRDHSPSLIPIKTITLNECPTPKRKRSTAFINNKSSPKTQPCAVNVILPVIRTPEDDKAAKKSSYLLNLKKILTPNTRPGPKNIDRPPKIGSEGSSPTSVSHKRSRFKCFGSSPSTDRPNSPRVLKILKDIGQDKYSELFRKEEIDLDVFQLLTKGDLVKLGVNEENDVQVILQAAQINKQ